MSLPAASSVFRRGVAASATIALAMTVLLALAPGAASVTNTCRARNMTQDTSSRSNLQAVIREAAPGDKISVKYVCVGNFQIKKPLTLVGKATADLQKAVLHGGRAGRVLIISAEVTLSNLRITGGDMSGVSDVYQGYGAGIVNNGTLTLLNTTVRGNRADNVAGIYNHAASLVMEGSSSVSRNTAQSTGGIYNDGGTLTLNDTSTVDGNTATSGGGGGIGTIHGDVVLNDASSVSGNHASDNGGGIYIDSSGSVAMNGTSSVSGNTADGYGGGIITSLGTLVLNDSSSVSGNTADADDGGDEMGGGIAIPCSILDSSGAVDGGNVDENFRGSASPVEDNVFLLDSCT